MRTVPARRLSFFKLAFLPPSGISPGTRKQAEQRQRDFA
jgi:hypothetical protein